MATFTINSGAVVDWDSLSGGSTNSTLDLYNIGAGSTLRIDCDTNQCANHSAAFGSLDNVAWTDIGGTLLIDSSGVRVIPFNSGASTVPAIGTAITQGGVSAELLGVWADWQSNATAAGAAMPTTGFIKVKDKTGGSFAAGALTGISASATGADVTGWIEVLCADTGTCTVPRRGTFQVVGDWFELEPCNGSRGQVIPCPTSATYSGVIPAVWIETGNGTGIFEPYHSVGSLAASSSIPTDATRGKIFWHTTSGLRIGSDGANNVGYLPASGARVRIPNVFFTCCTRTGGGSGARVTPSATLATRWELVMTSAGLLNVTGATWLPYANCDRAVQANWTDSGIADILRLVDIGRESALENVCVAPIGSATNIALTATKCTGGLVLRDCVFASVGTATQVAQIQSTIVDSDGAKFVVMGARAGTTPAMYLLNGGAGSVYKNSLFIGSGVDCRVNEVLLEDSQYCDRFAGVTDSTGGTWCVLVRDASDVTVDGVTLPVASNPPYRPFLELVGATDRITIRNIGVPGGSAVDFDGSSEGLVKFSGTGTDVRIQRCSVVNTRSNLWQGLVGYQNTLIENVFGDDADDGRSFTSMTERGCRHSENVALSPLYDCSWRGMFTSDTAGFIQAVFAEPEDSSDPEHQITGGAPLYAATHTVIFAATGDQVTLEMDHFALGYTATANVAPTYSAGNIGNMLVEFAVDLGSGYSSWATYTQANWFAVGAIDPAIGIRIKMRVTCVTPSTGNTMSFAKFPLVTTLTAQTTNLYPLDVSEVVLTGLEAGSEVRAYLGTDPATATVLGSTESSGTSFTFSHSAGGQDGYIVVRKVGFKFIKIPLTYSSDGDSFPVQQTPDPWYQNN